MSKELLINVTSQETRIATVENGVLQELQMEQNHSRGIVGNIYKGKVVRILPGMQSAFIDIGEQRTAFLHQTDIFTPRIVEFRKDRHAPDPQFQHSTTVEEKSNSIGNALYEGQEIIVQVIKNPLGDKGARLTTELTIAARHLVYLPYSDYIGVSQKIQDIDERERLREMLKSIVTKLDVSGGYIIRTVTDSATDVELMADVIFLTENWKRIQMRINKSPPLGLVHENISLLFRTIRDLIHFEIDRIRIDSIEAYKQAREFVNKISPGIQHKIEHYMGERPIFDLFAIENEINKALDKNVPLKSGGNLIIDQTEAMTTVDVNSGSYVGRKNMEETLFITNLEAIHALGRQLRLRNIGGIIIIDFIDMADHEHKRSIMCALKKTLANDRARTFIAEMSPFGLVEVTRKRTHESLQAMLCEPCSVCKGIGTVKSAETICYSIFREIIRKSRKFEANKCLIIVSQVIAYNLLDQDADGLQELQEFIGKPINVQVDSTYHQQDYDVVLI